jgi:hypothetical protein
MSTRGLAKSVVAVVSVAFLGVFASDALASDTVQVGVNSTVPEQGIPFNIEFSGVSEAINTDGDGPRLSAVIRPAGGIGCQATFGDDHSAAGGVSKELVGPEEFDQPSVGPGPYSKPITYSPPNVGSYLVCAWLEGESNATVAGPMSATFSAGPPHVYQLSVGLPQPALPGVAFQIAYTTHTDQQLDLRSVIRPSGALPCAANYSLDTEQDREETNLIGESFFGSSSTVFGGPSTRTATTTETAAGPYLICTWIEGPNTGEVDAAGTTPIYVGTPPPPPPPPPVPVHASSPHLALHSVHVSKHHGTVIAGRGAGTLTGHVRVTVACRRASAHGTARVVRGRFSLRLATPHGCARRGKARVTVSWAGSRSFSKQSVTESVTVTR